jgi:hypothetical protein
MELDLAFCRVSFKVGSDIAKLQGHDSLSLLLYVLYRQFAVRNKEQII